MILIPECELYVPVLASREGAVLVFARGTYKSNSKKFKFKSELKFIKKDYAYVVFDSFEFTLKKMSIVLGINIDTIPIMLAHRFYWFEGDGTFIGNSQNIEHFLSDDLIAFKDYSIAEAEMQVVQEKIKSVHVRGTDNSQLSTLILHPNVIIYRGTCVETSSHLSIVLDDRLELMSTCIDVSEIELLRCTHNAKVDCHVTPQKITVQNSTLNMHAECTWLDAIVENQSRFMCTTRALTIKVMHASHAKVYTRKSDKICAHVERNSKLFIRGDHFEVADLKCFDGSLIDCTSQVNVSAEITVDNASDVHLHVHCKCQIISNNSARCAIKKCGHADETAACTIN